MFNNIARSYDFLNHFLSFGIDIIWRRKLIKVLKKYRPELVLDIATGTGDLAIMATKTSATKIIGIDISEEMVEVGKKKIEKRCLQDKIELKVGDAEFINEKSEAFDAAIVAFGVRNFENLEKGLSEFNRVLKKNQPLIILEFSKPTKFPIKQFYKFYSFKFLPFVGKIVSKDKRAYEYLPESIRDFPSGNEFLDIMNKCNFTNCYQIPLSFRIATIYVGHKS